MTKLYIDIADFLKTGNFGPLRLGSTLKEVEDLFGYPQSKGIGDNCVAEIYYQVYNFQFNSSKGYYDPDSPLLAIYAFGLPGDDTDFENDQLHIEGNTIFPAIKTFGQAKTWCKNYGIAFTEEIRTGWVHDFQITRGSVENYAKLKLANGLILSFFDGFKPYGEAVPMENPDDFYLVTVAYLDIAAIEKLPYYFQWGKGMKYPT